MSPGPPWEAVTAAAAALQHIDHYPAANCEPALSDLVDFLAGPQAAAGGPNDATVANLKSRTMLGNGASELIDLGIYFVPSLCVLHKIVITCFHFLTQTF